MKLRRRTTLALGIIRGELAIWGAVSRHKQTSHAAGPFGSWPWCSHAHRRQSSGRRQHWFPYNRSLLPAISPCAGLVEHTAELRAVGRTDLLVKEVNRSGRDANGKPWRRRYIVCLNEAEAKKDAADREAILAGLDKALRRGDKSLVGNRGYRRFLKSKSGGRFEIDPRRVALDALYDGIYVIRVTMKLTPLQATLRYRDRWMVEDIFRTGKSLLATRPIFHKYDETYAYHRVPSRWGECLGRRPGAYSWVIATRISKQVG
jgi:hypothetical protein